MPWLVCGRCLFCWFCWVGCWFLSLGKFDLNHRLIPVVDRPCLALVRQCRKKNHCALFLCAAYDSGAAYVDGCCGSLGTLLSLGSPHYFRSRFYHHKLATPLFCACLVSSPPFHRKGGLSGTSLWHIVRPVLQCSVADQSLRSSCLPMTNLAQLHDCHSCYDERSIDQKKGPSSNALLLLSYTLPGFYPLHTMIPPWFLSPFFSEPHRIDQPVAYCPACLPVPLLSSSLIFFPTSFLSYFNLHWLLTRLPGISWSPHPLELH